MTAVGGPFGAQAASRAAIRTFLGQVSRVEPLTHHLIEITIAGSPGAHDR